MKYNNNITIFRIFFFFLIFVPNLNSSLTVMAHLVSKAGFLTFDTEEAERNSTMLDTLTFVAISVYFNATWYS